MRIALITDLHANREAVEAVFEDAERRRAEAYVFLGDFVGYGADPGWVVDRVGDHLARGAIAVMGNHDAAVVQGPTQTMHPDARQVVEWTRAALTEAQIAVLAGLPQTAVDEDRLYVHANAFDPGRWGYIDGRMEAVRSMQATPCRYTFCGHVHEPRLFHLAATGKAGDFVPTADMPIPLLPHRQWLVIPGSAGQPRDGNPAACWALFDTTAATLTYRRVPYDHETASAKIRAAGLPQRLAQRLKEGF